MRRSIRLPGYNYSSSGAYFVTTCAWQRRLLFEQPELQSIIMQEWEDLPYRFPTVSLDAFVVMPNHVHLIVWLDAGNSNVGAPLAGASGIGTRASPAPTSRCRVIGRFQVTRWH